MGTSITTTTVVFARHRLPRPRVTWLRCMNFYYLVLACLPLLAPHLQVFAEAAAPTPKTKPVALIDPVPLCRPCGAGTYSNAKNSNCSQCEEGYCPKLEYCLPCPAGQYSNATNATSCLQCKAGSVSFGGNTTCSPCKAGETSAADQAHCQACNAGYFNPTIGGTCQACPPGTFSLRKSTFCQPCPQGSYSALSGLGKCTDCGRGRWNSFIGSSTFADCLECPVGYYCPNLRTPQPLPCPSNHYCESGSADPSKCAILFVSKAKAENCHPSAFFYITLVCGCLAVIVVGLALCFVIMRRYRRTRVGYQWQRGGTRVRGRNSETGKLIPEPLPGPVYTGL
ncbi:multiple epidermal growth factor-like domains protein 6 [Balamuthia mandrillaris]